MRCNDSAEVLFDPLVFPLGKSISLGVKCSGQVLFDSEFLGDGLPKVGSETRVSITDDLGRKAEPSVYVIEV